LNSPATILPAWRKLTETTDPGAASGSISSRVRSALSLAGPATDQSLVQLKGSACVPAGATLTIGTSPTEAP
jgi:hypothetical protein